MESADTIDAGHFNFIGFPMAVRNSDDDTGAGAGVFYYFR